MPTFFLNLESWSSKEDAEDISARRDGAAVFEGLAHVSDWLPTFASFAKIREEIVASLNLDGVDLSETLLAASESSSSTTTRSLASPRTEILHEMYYGASAEESLFPEDLIALRVGKWKLVASNPGGGFRDTHYYSHRADGADRLNSSDTTWITALANGLLDTLEMMYGDESKVDTIRDLAVHLGVQAIFRSISSKTGHVRLYDIESDPTERVNRAREHPDIVARLTERAEELRALRPPQQKYWMTVDRDTVWPSTLKPGNCEGNPHVKSADECVFAHPWIDDDVDESTIELVFGASAWPFLREIGKRIALRVALPLAFAAAIATRIARRT